jgi:uncharacterized protein involved in exopolysaccharide biosynthesis
MERTYTLQDLGAALRRRRALALGVAGVALGVGLAAALALPSEYAARSVVQVEPRRLPVDFFPAQNAPPFEDRMRTLKHGVLARPVLERVVKEVGLYHEMGDDLDGRIERLRRDTEVRLEGEVSGGPPSLLFVVEVRGRDPDQVTRAAELLPRIYAEVTRNVLHGQARALRETLDAQTASLSESLAGHERKLLDFKVAHQAELPEMIESNARAIGRAQALLEQRLAGMAEARRRRTFVLASIPEGPSAPGMAEAALDGALRRLQAARAAYGDDHPDVLRAQREHEEALGRRDQEGDRFRRERVGEQVARIDAELRAEEREIAALREEIARYQARVEAAPRWGQELAALGRDYDVLRAKYTATVSRREDAAAAEALFAADGPGMFRTLEPAIRPVHPVAPDRGRIAGIALLVALALGVAAAGIAEWLDSSLRGPEDAGELEVPVLAAIPRIGPRTRGA